MGLRERVEALATRLAARKAAAEYRQSGPVALLFWLKRYAARDPGAGDELRAEPPRERPATWPPAWLKEYQKPAAPN